MVRRQYQRTDCERMMVMYKRSDEDSNEADFNLREDRLAELTLGDALRVKTGARRLAEVRKALRDLERNRADLSVAQQLASNPHHAALARTC